MASIIIVIAVLAVDCDWGKQSLFIIHFPLNSTHDYNFIAFRDRMKNIGFLILKEEHMLLIVLYI